MRGTEVNVAADTPKKGTNIEFFAPKSISGKIIKGMPLRIDRMMEPTPASRGNNLNGRKRNRPFNKAALNILLRCWVYITDAVVSNPTAIGAISRQTKCGHRMMVGLVVKLKTGTSGSTTISRLIL